MSKKAANQNMSFSDLMNDPASQLAESMIAECLHDLETVHGIQSTKLAEVLFQFMLIQMEPPEELNAQSASAWGLQLFRFRDELQSRVDEVHDLYDISESHN